MNPENNAGAQSCCALSSKAQPDGAPSKPSRLWLWVVAAFALQAAAWTAWFIIASHHQVAEVPLATSGGGAR